MSGIGHTSPTSWHDLNGLNQITSKLDASAATREVAEQFESIFLNMMLKSAREATMDGGLFSDSSLGTYQQMFDQQVAVAVSGQGFGLADLIVAQIERAAGTGDS